MTAYRTVRRLSPEMAAYVAGIVDGEGTITLSAEHRGDQRCISVSVSNTDRRHLEFTRAKRAAIALDRYVTLTPRNGKYTPEMLRRREEFVREFLAIGPGPRSGVRIA